MIPGTGFEPGSGAGRRVPAAGAGAATCEPAGAAVYIDGEKVGTLPWEGEVEVGEHTLRITKKGYIPLTRTITATPPAFRCARS